MRRLLALVPATLLVLSLVPPAQADGGAMTATAQAHWAIVASPSPAARTNLLLDVAALSVTDAWAVGTRTSDGISGPGETLIEHWDGTQWTVVPSPSPGAAANVLHTVEAISPTDVWAAGTEFPSSDSGDSPSGGILIEHWDGTSWTVVAGPDTGAGGGGVFALARIPGKSTLWGVGAFRAASEGVQEQPMVIRWNGSKWRVVPSKAVGAGADLLGVAAASGSAMAVGARQGPSANKTFSERWTGSGWTTVPTPNPLPGNNFLQDIGRVPGTQAMWAVGYGKDAGTSTIAEYWDGSSWSTVPTPNPVSTDGSAGSWFNGVAALGPDRAWAVGYSHVVRGPVYNTLIEQWNGTTWEIVASPAPGEVSLLNAVARVPGTAQTWAVGESFTDGLVGSTLIEHFG